MRSGTSIGNSLSRIIVSVLLTCPTLIDHSYDSANTGFALALPTTAVGDLKHGLPDLRVELPASERWLKRSVHRRHGDDEDEEEEEGHKGMDMSAVKPPDPTFSSESASPTGTPDELHAGQEDKHIVHQHSAAVQEESPATSGKEGQDAHSHSEHADTANHGHAHHSANWVPLTEFNETDVLVKHGPAPLSFLYYDLVLNTSETLDFCRTGLSAYGNATTEMSTLQPEELIAWQREQYTHGAGSLEESRVMGGDGRSHPGLMALHITSFALAYFAILPIVLALRAAKYTSVAYGVCKVVFGVLVFVGWISGVWYKAATPDLYVGHKHNVAGNLLLLATVAIGAIDLLAVGRRIYRFATNDQIDVKAFIDIVLRGQGEKSKIMEEYETIALANQMELDEVDESNLSMQMQSSAQHQRHERRNSVIFTAPWANRADGDHANRRSSGSSEASTLHDSPVASSPHEMDKPFPFPTRGMSTTSSGSGQPFRRPTMTDIPEHIDARPERRPRTTNEKIARVGTYLMHVLSRGLVIWAYIVTIMGIVVYTGMGRKWFLPSLLAHLIKGSIFFWYGLLTFGRYLGAFAEYGWAWNARSPHKRHSSLPSAEMIESFVIFFYGITNTWMERIGAAPGSPYTIKQVQHISIAVMFWFGGLSGMGLESKVIRRVLASSAVRGKAGKTVKEPKSYSFSFNPFPALVIGILGIAMSAHKQDYVFQVTIHELWGYCLAGFSLFRLLTYFFLWVSPPSDSVMPSRPPTEGLAAFCLACGGVLFFLSDEEIAYAAMRHAYDDGFAFLCWTVALVCFIFTWALVVMAVKGWAVERKAQQQRARETAPESLSI
ncbi:hypothetical protein NCC49_001728 [Naganishia albida]|nr:hypothetical protein NCC49_001728 [Naganishia albida]